MHIHSRCWVPFAAALLACTGQQGHATTPEPAHYEGRCSFLGLEQVDAPTESDAESDADSVSLVARYRFGQGKLALLFQVSRSRVDDLRAHLSAHPNVLCGPDQVDVPPFQGQTGTPTRDR